jgi:LysR family glycine cleavage system transcriptional activator
MLKLNRVPLRALRAVEAVSRHGSLARAAEELRVSAGAVSQQIAAAEAALGFALFERGPRGMRVTPRARQCCALLTAGFSQLAEAVAQAEEGRNDVLTVSVAPAFASRWLIWRLPAFQTANPQIQVRLDASIGLVDPRQGDVDLCIRIGRGPWPGLAAERLFPQVIFPVCAPSIAHKLRTPADLLTVPIIREPSPMFGWQEWLGRGEPDAEALPPGPVFSDASLCLDAAISGTGVFLTFETLAVDALAHGRLVEPFRRRVATDNAYHFVAAEGRSAPPARLFRNWLKREIAASGLGNASAAVPLGGREAGQ